MSNKSKVQVDPYLKVLQRIARSLESIDEGINMFAFHSEGVQECMAAQEAQEQEQAKLAQAGADTKVVPINRGK